MVRNKIDLITVPNPLLRQKSKEVKISEIKKKEFIEFLKIMAKVMDDYDGIGLSAIQLGVPKKVFIIKKDFEKEGFDKNDSLSEVIVYINPQILDYSQEKEEGWEGCLSIPNIECLVERSKRIKVKYLDVYGNEIIEELDQLRAIVFQHEYDHTQGILIIDKAKEIKEAGD